MVFYHSILDGRSVEQISSQEVPSQLLTKVFPSRGGWEKKAGEVLYQQGKEGDAGAQQQEVEGSLYVLQPQHPLALLSLYER